MGSADKLVLLVALAIPIGVITLALPRMTEIPASAGDIASVEQVGAGTPGAAARPSALLGKRPVGSNVAPPPTLVAPPRPTLTPTAVPATPTPAGQAASASASGPGGRYTVQRGDELRYIAAQYGVSMAAVLAANAIPDPDNLRVGQVLTIPGAPTHVVSETPASVAGVRAYTVQPGDELKYIAARYGVSLSAILAANSVPDPDNLRVGQVLTIPDNSP